MLYSIKDFLEINFSERNQTAYFWYYTTLRNIYLVLVYWINIQHSNYLLTFITNANSNRILLPLNAHKAVGALHENKHRFLTSHETQVLKTKIYGITLTSIVCQ
jgi:uncharacterized membrane-anchored protein YitT (DUF2179 family)